jgi:hypothetical protein
MYKPLSLLITVSLLAMACSRQSVEPELVSENTRLQKKFTYDSSEKLVGESLYEYSGAGLLQRVTEYQYLPGKRMTGYELYEYDSSQQLSKSRQYQISGNAGAEMLTRETSYEFHNERLVREEVQHVGDNTRLVNTYDYADDQLIRKSVSDDKGQLHSYVIWEYNDAGQVAQEKHYFANVNNGYWFHAFEYRNGVLSRVQEFHSQDVSTPLSQKTYVYDQRQNVREERFALLNPALCRLGAPPVVRYEYL